LPEELAESLIKYLSYKKTNVSFAVYDHKGENFYHFYGNKMYDTASTVKVSVMLAVLKHVEVEERQLMEEEIGKIKNMITKSNNEDTTTLWKLIGKESSMNNLFEKMELTNTKAGENGYWGLTKTTPVDQAKLLNYIFKENELFSEEQRKFALDMMSQVVKDQFWGISKGNEDADISLKNGWVPKSWNSWVINSIGCVKSSKKEYTIAIFSENSPTQQYGIEVVEHVSELVAKSLKVR
jgi:hypothetical protein